MPRVLYRLWAGVDLSYHTVWWFLRRLHRDKDSIPYYCSPTAIGFVTNRVGRFLSTLRLCIKVFKSSSSTLWELNYLSWELCHLSENWTIFLENWASFVRIEPSFLKTVSVLWEFNNLCGIGSPLWECISFFFRDLNHLCKGWTTFVVNELPLWELNPGSCIHYILLLNNHGHQMNP